VEDRRALDPGAHAETARCRDGVADETIDVASTKIWIRCLTQDPPEAVGAATSLMSWQAAGIVLALGVMSGVLDLLPLARRMGIWGERGPVIAMVIERALWE
jgi:hypothetical protein